MTIREHLADRLLNLIEYFPLGFEELVIISLGHDRCRLIRLLNNSNTIICWKRRDKLYRLIDVRDFASEAAVTSEEARRIDAVRANRLHVLDIRLLLKCGDARLQAVRIADGADRIVLGANAIETLA